MRRATVGSVVAALLVLVSAPVSTAGAPNASTAWCYGTWPVSLSPGATTTPGTHTFATHGATITCLGSVRGHEVTGSGTMDQEGVAQGTVLMGSGSGTKTVVVPTTAGPETLAIPYSLTYSAGVLIKDSPSFVGPFVCAFHPTQGDGITAPVTEIAIVCEGLVTS